VRLQTGLRLGPYEVLALLGAGGMAEVYRARDTRLARDVALKMVTEALSTDPDLVRRFEQEARVAGCLNHPNLVAVYDFGVHDGNPYFVTELLRGESLRARLARGAIPTSTAVDWAIQMARGLAAAHARGVIHRDVKPDNVFVCADGQVKLLDFGIAKLAEPAALSGTHDLMAATVTPTGGATRTGSVLGTPGYMSPEQLRGESLDARSDIFSWAATVYEALAGHRAFPGGTLVESGYSILHRDPEPLPPEVPVPVAQVVLRCLEKDPARRIQSASDLAFALEVASHSTDSIGKSPLPTSRWKRPAALSLGALAAALLLAATAVLVRGRQRASSAPAPEFEQVTFRWGNITAARFLPDGRTAFSAAFENNPEQVFVRPAGSVVAQEIGLSDARLMASLGNAELFVMLHPRWTTIRTARGTLAQVPSVGGMPRPLAESAEFADWSPKGELLTVGVAGTGRTLESPPGNVLFRTNGWISNPRFSHSGQRIAFLHHPVIGGDLGEVVVLDGAGGAKVLGRRWSTSFGLAWAPDDSEVWFTGSQLRRNSLHAVGLDGRERIVYTSPSSIELEDIGTTGDVLLSSYVDRRDLYYVSKTGNQRLLSFTDWNTPLAAVSDSGEVLFTSPDPLRKEEVVQPVLAVLRRVDGSAPQVLGRGYALDLSADGRWALVLSEDTTQLTALPAGAGQARALNARDLTIHGARFLPENATVVAIGRAPSENDFRLYVLDGKRNIVSPVGDVRLRPWVLHLSPDGRVAAVLTADSRLALISIENGSALSVPSQFMDMSPRGWSAEGHLWLSQGGSSAPVRLRLLRVDLKTGRTLEERTVSPPDLAGSVHIAALAISPNSEHVVFVPDRTPGCLFIARGLWTPRN
jgi:serine/threonine protein kinase